MPVFSVLMTAMPPRTCCLPSLTASPRTKPGVDEDIKINVVALSELASGLRRRDIVLAPYDKAVGL